LPPPPKRDNVGAGGVPGVTELDEQWLCVRAERRQKERERE